MTALSVLSFFGKGNNKFFSLMLELDGCNSFFFHSGSNWDNNKEILIECEQVVSHFYGLKGE